ncbi:hypothetical protein [Devosia sediminis]|uniref:Uncharacterized protein n=1 Tax=Devosia sediminis TaxID=2798801 RepID=A0A934MG03_9HYPH|nr:hypothetical protein [Devosia sediminis]MBJ3783422.1 hypothetical protein [Devosia sediminis]
MTLELLVPNESWKDRIQAAVDSWFGPDVYPGLDTDGERCMRMNQIATELGLPLVADHESLVLARAKFNAVIEALGGTFSLDAFMAAQSDGFYFDFTKTDRHYQEAYGPTLAGLSNQVAFAADQRSWNGQTMDQALAASPELIADPLLNSSAGWLFTQASIAGGQLLINSPDGSYAAGSVVFNGLSVGDTYVVECDVASVSAGSIAAAMTATQSNGLFAGTNRRALLVPNATTAGIEIKRGASVPTNAAVDRVSMKRLRGRHGRQTTAQQRPFLLSSGAKFDGNDDNLLTNYAAGANENFVVALVTMPTTLGASQWIAGATGAANDRAYFAVTVDGQLAAGTGTTAVIQGPDFRGQRVVVGMSFNSTTRRLFGGTSLIVEGAYAGGLPTTTPWRLGSNNSNGSAAGFFAGSVEKILGGRQFLDLPTFIKIRNSLLTS